MELETGQHYNSRVFWGGPKAIKAAHDFVSHASKQVDHPFEVSEHGDSNGATVDLDEWPDAVGFGDWFGEWAKRWEIQVHD